MATKDPTLLEALASIGLTWFPSPDDWMSRVDILDAKTGEIVLRCASAGDCWELYHERVNARPTPSTEQAQQILARLKPAAIDVLLRAMTEAVIGPQAAALARMKLVTYVGPVEVWKDFGAETRLVWLRSYEVTELGDAVVRLTNDEEKRRRAEQ